MSDLEKQMNDKPSRILYFLANAMYYGGTEAFIMNYYRHIDRSKIVIDFVCQGYDKGVFDDELESYGSVIYHVPFKNKKPIQYSREVKKIIEEGDYKLVQSMMDAMGVWPLMIAKKCGVPFRIAHCLNSEHQTLNRVKLFINDMAKRALLSTANIYWACSKQSGKWLFGERAFNEGRVDVIYNAIEASQDLYDEKNRINIRRKLGLNETDIVIGHVGQFREQKNHRFLMKIFEGINRKHPDYKLVLVGDGPLKKEIEGLVKKKGLDETVIFTGPWKGVGDILSVFDVFLFPSLYEGISIVAIEAQCNGLPCIFSDTNSSETFITQQAMSLGLDEPLGKWVDVVEKAVLKGRVDTEQEIDEAGYNISVEAAKYQNRYQKLLG